MRRHAAGLAIIALVVALPQAASRAADPPRPILTAGSFLAAGTGVANDPAQLGYLLGTVETLVAVAEAGRVDGGKPPFCPPPGEAMDLPKLLDIVDRAVRARPLLGERPLAEALIFGFVRLFPC